MASTTELARAIWDMIVDDILDIASTTQLRNLSDEDIVAMIARVIKSHNPLEDSDGKAVHKSRGLAARIARECGVHPATVSKVLSGQRNGAYGKRTARVVEAVKAAAERLEEERRDA